MDKLFTQLLAAIGETPTRPGLERTPERCAEMWREFSRGYTERLEDIVEGALLPAGTDKTVVVRGLEFCSMCEHHLLPFYGTINVCYRPI